MDQKAIPLVLRTHYRKWLRYYLDFRVKYPPLDSKSDQVRLFIEKLRSKNQAQNQLDQAAHALSILFQAQAQRNLSPDNSGNTGMKPSPSLSPP